jgi:hypothetical protein
MHEHLIRAASRCAAEVPNLARGQLGNHRSALDGKRRQIAEADHELASAAQHEGFDRRTVLVNSAAERG